MLSRPALTREFGGASSSRSSKVNGAARRRRAALDERLAVRGERRVVHVPAWRVQQVSYTISLVVCAVGGRHAAHGAGGSGFSSASESLGVLTCRIGGSVRRAVWASASVMVCNAPRGARCGGRGANRREQQRVRLAGVAARRRRAAVERSDWRRDGVCHAKLLFISQWRGKQFTCHRCFGPRTPRQSRTREARA